MVKEEKRQVLQYLDVANVYYVINPMLLIVCFWIYSNFST